MANEDLNLKVGLKDNASKGLNDLTKNVESFSTQFKHATPHVEGATASLLRFGTGVAIGNLATLAARKILQDLVQEFKAVIDASNQMQSSMIGLSSVSAAFGQSQSKARDSAKSLAEDGLMSVTDAANGLKNLLASGFNLQESINLMNGFKDAAAFNRQGTLEFGQAIVGATQGIKNQNSIMVDNVGITKNLSIILKEAGLDIQDLGKVSSDASVRMALYNGLMREASIFQGDAARSALTLSGAQSQLKTAVFNLRAEIGGALAPMVQYIVSEFANWAKMSAEGVAPSLVNVAKAGVWLVGVVKEMGLIVGSVLTVAFRSAQLSLEQLGMGIGTIGRALWKLATGDLKGVAEEWSNGTKAMKDVAQLRTGQIVDVFTDFGFKSTKIAEEIGVRLQKIDIEGLKGFTDVARTAIQALPPLADEEAQKVAENLAKEIKRFAKSMTQLVKNFDESMRDAVISHREKVTEIKKQIEDETKAFKDQEQKIRDSHQDELKQFRIAMEARLSSLQVQLDREMAKGKNADLTKVKNLELMLKKEKLAMQDQLGLKEELIQKEIDEEKAKHEEKLTELNDELNKELEIEKANAEEFAKFKDAIAESDIARMKRKFADERQLMIEDHKDRIQEITKQVAAENAARSGSSNGTPSGGTKKLSFEEAFPVLYKGWPEAGARADFNATGGKNKAGYQELSSKLNAFAEGGIVSKPTLGLIGEAGSEAVLPLSKPDRMKEILGQLGIGQRSITINAPITVVKSEIDIDNLVERLAFQIGKAGMV